jgi:sugar/nucleoside kinase (ribokinase family)
MLRANLEDCLEYGNAVAALSTTRAGSTEALRDRHNRETFLQKANVRRDHSRASQ